MSEAGEQAPGPDPEAEGKAAIMVERALALLAHSEASRLRDYLEAGRILREAKAALGHGNWLDFLDLRFPGRYVTIKPTLSLIDGLDADAWLAGQLAIDPESWSVEKALEYLRAGPELQERVRAEHVGTNRAGTRRLSLQEATAAQIRHHRRFISGTLPKPDPFAAAAAALARSRFYPLGTAAELFREFRQRFATIRNRINLS